jgi:hypothetical protein
MATNKPLQTILNDLPDNNAKEITPADVRQIATSSFSPQLVLAGCQSLDTDTSGFNPDERAVYGCNYYNPYFFAPQATTKTGLNNIDQIWQITNYGNGLTPGTHTAICTADPIPGFNFAPTTNGVWEVEIDALGEIESFKIISPAQGWQSGSLPGTFPGRFEQTGYLDISGNISIKVRFNGPLRGLVSQNVAGEFEYSMTTNPNSSDQSTAFPGQGSQAAADFTTANTPANMALFGTFNGASPLYGIRVGRRGGSGSWTNINNFLQIKTDGSRAVQFQIWRTPGGNL